MTDPAVKTNPLWVAYEFLGMLAVIWVFCFISFCWMPFAFLFRFILPKRPGALVGRWVIMWAFRIYLRSLTLLFPIRLDFHELDQLAAEGPLIIAANHPSLLDAVLICSRLPNAVCVMKAALMDNLVFGVGARLAGYIRNNAPLAMILNAREALQDGAHLVIFPEGTRTEKFPLNPCSASIGLIASRTGIPVQTVLIDYSNRYLCKGWPLTKRPSLPLRGTVRLGKRFEPGRDAALFTSEMENYFRAELSEKSQNPSCTVAFSSQVP